MAQNIVELGFNIDSFSTEQKAIVQGMQQVLDLAKQMNGATFNPISGGGAESFANSQKETSKIIQDLTGKIEGLNAKVDEYKTKLKEDTEETKRNNEEKKKQREETKSQNEERKKQALLDRQAIKDANDKAKAEKQAAKDAAESSNEWKQLTKAYEDAANRARNLQIIAPGSQAAKDATKTAADMKATIAGVNQSIGIHTDNVGNYSGALSKFALELRGMRGPAMLLGEALGVPIQAINAMRLAVEHGAQSLAKYFAFQERKAAASIKEAAATEANTVATEEQVVVTEAQAVASGEATVAVEAQAVATEGAAAATGTLWAMLAPIVGIIALIVAPLIILGKIMWDYGHAAEHAAEANKALFEAKSKLLEGTKTEIAFQENIDKIKRRSLENELSAAEKSGQSQEKIFAIKKKLADYDSYHAGVIKTTQDVTDDSYNKTLKKLGELEDKHRSLNKEFVGAQEDALKKSQKWFGARWVDGGKDPEEVKKKIEQNKAELDFMQSSADMQKDILLKSADAEREVNNNKLEEAKKSADERRAILLESVKLDTDLQKAKTAIILNDERSTEAQKLAAMRSNYAQEKAMAKAELQNILNDPSHITGKNAKGQDTYDATGINAQKKYSVDLLKLKADEKEAERKLELDYSNKIKAAILGISKDEIETQIAQEEALTKNTEKELQIRLTAFAATVTDKALIINKQAAFETEQAKNTGKVKEEIDLIEANRKKAISALTANSEKEAYDITKSYLDKKEKDLQESGKGNNNVANTEKYEAESIALNNSLNKNLISIGEYNNQKKLLDEKYSIESTQSEVDKDAELLAKREKNTDELSKNKEAAQQDLNAAISGGSQFEIDEAQGKLDAITNAEQKNANEISTIRAKLSADKKKLSDEEVKKEVEAKQKIKELETKLASATFNLVKTAIDATFAKKEDAIKREQEIKDEQFNNEISAVQKSSLSQQDKAALEMQLQAQKQASDKAAAKEERKLKHDQAVFDKEMNVVQIIAATAVGIMNALKIPIYGEAMAAIIGATGAIELATVAAAPIPSYAEGTDYHKGGLARFGEAGAELIKEPNKTPYMAYTETISYLPKGTQVIPMSATIRDDSKDSGNSWEQTKYLAAQIRKSNKEIKNVVNVAPSRIDLNFEFYMNHHIKGIS